MINLRMRMILTVCAAAAFAVVLACQKPLVIEYVKYESDAGVPRISAVDAKKEFDAGHAIFVDSRSDVAYKAEHLPGALNILFGSADEAFSQLPKGKKIFVYCS